MSFIKRHGISILAIILSIIAICRSYPNDNLGFDYLGIIVGMFALLITVLIGWQIFSIINIKDIEKANIKLKESILKEV